MKNPKNVQEKSKKKEINRIDSDRNDPMEYFDEQKESDESYDLEAHLVREHGYYEERIYERPFRLFDYRLFKTIFRIHTIRLIYCKRSYLT